MLNPNLKSAQLDVYIWSSVLFAFGYLGVGTFGARLCLVLEKICEVGTEIAAAVCRFSTPFIHTTVLVLTIT
jgi:hypothetical protein